MRWGFGTTERDDYVYSYQLEAMLNKYEKRKDSIDAQPNSIRAYIFSVLKCSESQVCREANISRTILCRLYANSNYKLSEQTVLKLLPVLLCASKKLNTLDNFNYVLNLMNNNPNDYYAYYDEYIQK
ncbi:MAG: hypothetical protein RR929_00835 [Erysipelotrichaceae bacterium]